MTSETALRCFHRHRTAKTVLQRLGNRARMNDREVETPYFLIVTDATFIEDSPVLKHISLTSLALAKAVEYRFGNRVKRVSDRKDATFSVPHNLVVVGTVAKVQSGMLSQNITAFDRLQRTAHRIRQTRGCLRDVALCTGLAPHETNAGKLMSWAPS